MHIISSDHFDIKMFDDLADDVLSLDLPICLVGDFNARTGKLNDMLNIDDFVVKKLESVVMITRPFNAT